MTSKWSSKTIIKTFKDIGFSVDIQTNLKEVDFFGITLNLQNDTYRPYKKPNDKLLYIQSSSNHPSRIIKQLPNSIFERLSKNFSNQEIFNTAKVEYEDELKKLGYNVDLKYIKNKSEKTKTPNRNLIWFNPHFKKSVSTGSKSFPKKPQASQKFQPQYS